MEPPSFLPDVEAQDQARHDDRETRLEDRKQTYTLLFCGATVTVVLLCILLPLSLSGVEYYQYGFAMRRSTGAVSTGRVYESGLYGLGPDFEFKTFNRGAHIVEWEEISMWSNSNSSEAVGLEFKVLLHLLRRTHYDIFPNPHPSQVFKIPDETLTFSPLTLFCLKG